MSSEANVGGINIVEQKSYAFAVRVVNLYKYLKENTNIYSLADQVVRSGTAFVLY